MNLAFFVRYTKPLRADLITLEFAPGGFILYLGDLKEAEHYTQQVIDSQLPSVLPGDLRTFGEIRLNQRDFAGVETVIKQFIQVGTRR